MITITYKLICDATESERYFESIPSVLMWMMGVGEEFFEWVTLTEKSGIVCDGYFNILNTYYW